MACVRQTKTNGAKSELFETIYNNLASEDEYEAEKLYSYFLNTDDVNENNSFVKSFGDYVNDKTNPDFLGRVDENGEPKLEYNQLAKKYYYTLKNGEQIFFPLVKRGLRGVFDYKQIEAIVSQLSLSYFEENTSVNFNNINFSENEKLPNLKGYIYNKLISKIKEAESKDETYLNALLLEDSLEFLNEWVEEVDAFYKRIGIKRIDTEDELEGDIELIAKDSKDPQFNKASFERDTKDAISTNTKLKLSLLRYEKDDVKNVDIIWGEATFVPFDDVYSTLLFSLADQVPITKNGIIEDIWELYLDKINEVSNKKPYLKQLIDNLNKQEFTENNKNEFVQAFRLHKNNFLITELKLNYKHKEKIDNLDGTFNEVTTQGLKVFVKNVSNSGNKSSILVSEWGNNFKNLFLNVDNSFKVNSNLKLQNIKVELIKLKDSFTNKNTGEDLIELVNTYGSILEKIGVSTTTEGLMHYLEDTKDIFNTNQQLSTLLTTVSNTANLLNGILKSSLSKKVIKEVKFENPLTSQSIFKKIAIGEAFFMSEGGDSSIRTSGKSKWLMSYPSYLSTKALEWKKDSSILRGLYNSSANNRASYLMKWLLGEENPDTSDTETLSKKRLEDFEIGNFATFQETQGDSESASDISENDYFIDHVNKVLNNGFVRTITPGDKVTDMQIKTGLRLNCFEGFTNGQIVLTKKVQDIFFNYVNGEINRSKEAHDEIKAFKNSPEKLTIHYHFKANKPLYNENGEIIYSNVGNAFKSQLFEELSYKSGSKNPLVIKIQQLLYDNNGMIKDFQGRDLSENPVGRIGEEQYRIKDLIQEYINKELSDGITKVGAVFREKGIFEVNEDGKTVNKLISKEVYDKYKFNPALASVADFHINSLIQNIEYTKMFTGDPAFYKNMIDFKKRVPATYTDGLQLRLQPGEEMFNVATISSVEIQSPFLKKIRETIGDDGAKKYENINSADAQAWITPQRWEFLTKRLGKWTDTHDSLYSKMLSDGNQKYSLDELKIAAQPLKGVYFDINGKTPIYLKYSQAVLTKNLITDSDLQKIYDKMTKDKNGKELDYNDQIHEVITLDGFKVGSATPTTIHNKDGSIMDDFDFNVQSLSNTGWKLQQDLPTKTFKDTEVGSQIQKNIFAGLKFNTDLTFDFQGKEITGQELIDEITDITGNLSDIGMESLMKEFGIGEDGKIGNVRGFYNSLIFELEKRGGSQNVIDALKKETALYGIPQAVSKIVNVFMSITTKRLIKIKTNGGSFIQMSNFGLNKKEANQKGVKWAPDALTTTNEPIQYVDDQGNIKIRPGGILLSGSFIAKHIPNYRNIPAEELFGYTNKEGIFIKGKIDSRILNNVIGYRIPNQGLASNDALKIVGILPEENGDTIVAYTGITTKTGSDKH